MTPDGICLRIFSNGYAILEDPPCELYQCRHVLDINEAQRLSIQLQSQERYSYGSVQIVYSTYVGHSIGRYHTIPELLWPLLDELSSIPPIPSLHSFDSDGRIIIYSNDIIHYYSPNLRIDEISYIDYSRVLQYLINEPSVVDKTVEMIVTHMKIIY